MSHVPKPPKPFTRLDLHLDRVSCQSTKRFDGGTDETVAVAITFGPEGTSAAGPDIDLGSFVSGQSRPVNRLLASFPLTASLPLPTFGVVLGLIEKDHDGGDTVSEALDAGGYTEVMMSALAVLSLALVVPLVDLPAAIAVVVLAALMGLVAIVVELATRDDVLGTRRSLFTVPIALLDPTASGRTEQLGYASHGGKYSADIRWSLS